jgi:hypothetical protein
MEQLVVEPAHASRQPLDGVTMEILGSIEPHVDPEIAYASVDYGSAASLSWGPIFSQKATAWWVGAVFDWSPVKNLDFALDAVYESSHQSTPLAWASYSVSGPFHNAEARWVG